MSLHIALLGLLLAVFAHAYEHKPEDKQPGQRSTENKSKKEPSKIIKLTFKDSNKSTSCDGVILKNTPDKKLAEECGLTSKTPQTSQTEDEDLCHLSVAIPASCAKNTRGKSLVLPVATKQEVGIFRKTTAVRTGDLELKPESFSVGYFGEKGSAQPGELKLAVKCSQTALMATAKVADGKLAGQDRVNLMIDGEPVPAEVAAGIDKGVKTILPTQGESASGVTPGTQVPLFTTSDDEKDGEFVGFSEALEKGRFAPVDPAHQKAMKELTQPRFVATRTPSGDSPAQEPRKIQASANGKTLTWGPGGPDIKIANGKAYYESGGKQDVTEALKEYYATHMTNGNQFSPSADDVSKEQSKQFINTHVKTGATIPAEKPQPPAPANSGIPKEKILSVVNNACVACHKNQKKAPKDNNETLLQDLSEDTITSMLGKKDARNFITAENEKILKEYLAQKNAK